MLFGLISCLLLAGLGFLIHSLLKPSPSPNPSPGYSSMYKDFTAFQNRPMKKHPTPAPYTTCNGNTGAPDKWVQSNCADGQRCSGSNQGCVLTCETDDDCKALFGSNNPGADKATLKYGSFENYPQHRYCMFVNNPRCLHGASEDIKEKGLQSCINVMKEWSLPTWPLPAHADPDKHIEDICRYG